MARPTDAGGGRSVLSDAAIIGGLRVVTARGIWYNIREMRFGGVEKIISI